MYSMYDVDNRYDGFAADSSLEQRISFIRRVYGHLLGAMLLFIASAALFVNTPAIYQPLFSLLSLRWGPLLLIGGFMAASAVAQSMAYNRTSRGTQYFGLGLYAVLEALIFTPLLLYVQLRQGADVIMQAGTVTLIIFGGLSAVVMLTRSDFSFLRNFLWLGSLAAFAVIIVSMFTGGGITGSLLFMSAMVVLFSGWILYDTSNILHHYDTDQYVAAALKLFSSVATLFWWVLRLMSSRD
ncbi:Modulator of FtsH protease YccA [Caulifigura coniformis]|uniref:Modulator of FtsH protease YccA n=1 Tax=Caulifigura coniformis TaxID=2527983 RepID=A0A517SDZ3_9PLAN|nr:Bax inhibitor-1 family protein [Caulifigura coniformis]QDT54331.1 Modulator of FtsH protease YccA [Caulifigura coniformis]